MVMQDVNDYKIYIILTYTGTILSFIIKLFTKAKYTHASISLDENLNKMYSFGRINPYNPFVGGFVHEGINKGTFKRFKNTHCQIYYLNVTMNEYKEIENITNNFLDNQDKYKFNVLGMFLTHLNIKYKRDKYYYCSEFVKYVLENAKVNIELPNITKPNDFQDVKELKLVYKGKLKAYR